MVAGTRETRNTFRSDVFPQFSWEIVGSRPYTPVSCQFLSKEEERGREGEEEEERRRRRRRRKEETCTITSEDRERSQFSEDEIDRIG